MWSGARSDMSAIDVHAGGIARTRLTLKCLSFRSDSSFNSSYFICKSSYFALRASIFLICSFRLDISTDTPSQVSAKVVPITLSVHKLKTAELTCAESRFVLFVLLTHLRTNSSGVMCFRYYNALWSHQWSKFCIENIKFHPWLIVLKLEFPALECDSQMLEFLV